MKRSTGAVTNYTAGLRYVNLEVRGTKHTERDWLLVGWSKVEPRRRLWLFLFTSKCDSFWVSLSLLSDGHRRNFPWQQIRQSVKLTSHPWQESWLIVSVTNVNPLSVGACTHTHIYCVTVCLFFWIFEKEINSGLIFKVRKRQDELPFRPRRWYHFDVSKRRRMNTQWRRVSSQSNWYVSQEEFRSASFEYTGWSNTTWRQKREVYALERPLLFTDLWLSLKLEDVRKYEKWCSEHNLLIMEALVFFFCFEKLDFSSELTCLIIREYSIALTPRHSYFLNLYDKKIIDKNWTLSLNHFFTESDIR